jgi:hypothetical protein
MSRYSIYVAALGAALALTFAGDASGKPKVWCVGNVCVTDDGGISPSKLPKRGTAPVTARLNGIVETRDGSHPPALQSIQMDIDKTIELDAVGLPTCRAGKIQSRTSAAARKACGSAIVGSGKAEVEVAFLEQAPFRSTGPVVLFNGGVEGRTTTVLLHAYVNVPAPTAIITKATVTRIDRGRFGLRVAARIPRIAGGAGSVTSFDLRVGRKYTYKGRKKSLLAASCPTGTWWTQGEAEFEDGTKLGINHPFSCTPRQ